MNVKVRLFLFITLFGLIVALLPSLMPAAQDSPPDVCQSGENLLSNCNFDGGTNGWVSFIEDGAADFSVLQGGGECHAPLCPAGYIVTQGHFVGGIYQQVPAAKGNTYFANIIWLAFDSLSNDSSVNAVAGGIGRRMGIDPFGGTDPRSPNVIWGPENWRNDCKICANQEVTAQAQADTITVFLRIDDRWRLRAAEKGYSVPTSKDQFWLDDIGLKLLEGSAAPLPPTDTPAPLPTDTPVLELPTDTPIPATAEPPEEIVAALADAPAEIATDEPSPEVEPDSPVATPTPVTPIAPPPTLTPSATPPSTATPEERERPRPTPTRTRHSTSPSETTLLSGGVLGLAGTTLCFGGGFLMLMGGVMGGLVWLYRLGWSKADDDDDSDEGEEIVVEMVEGDR